MQRMHRARTPTLHSRRHCCRQAALATCLSQPRLTCPRALAAFAQAAALWCGDGAPTKRGPAVAPARARSWSLPAAARSCSEVASKGGAARSGVGGVRGGRGAAAAARGAGSEPPLRPRDRALCGVWAGGARLAPFGASGGSEAAPGGSGLARRWSPATMGPADSSGWHLRGCCGCLHVSDGCEKYRDFREIVSPDLVISVSSAHAGVFSDASRLYGVQESARGPRLGHLV